MRIARFVFVSLILLVIGVVGFVYLAPETATHLALDAERKRAGLARKAIDLPGGLHYVYLEGGQGEPLMLLHGFGGNKDNFVRVARFLVPRYRVIVPDHIGFGESAHPVDADYAPPAQAVRLHALAQALGVTRVHLGGNSMGGHIAATYAAAYPADVMSLWLLDPTGAWSAPPGQLHQILKATGTNLLLVKSGDDYARLVDFAMSDPPFIPRPMIDVMAQERIRNDALEERIFKTIDADSVEDRIRGLPTPALIVWGAWDRALSVVSAEVFHALLPRSQVLVMPGVGHVPMMERPEQSATDYLRFRASLENTGDSRD